MRPIEARGAGALDEERDAERVFRRALARRPAAAPCRRRLSTPTAGTSRKRTGDVGRVEAAGEDDRNLAGNGGREGRRDPRAGPAGVRAAGRVEEDPLGAGGEERAGAIDDRRAGAGRAAAETRSAFQTGRPAAATSSSLVAGELDRVGIDGGDDLRDPLADPRRR